jgi:hypothetical protein
MTLLYPDAQLTIAANMGEDELQSSVEDALRLYGWLFYHTRDSRHSADGFPDICAVRAGQLVFAELKRQLPDPCTEKQREKLSPTPAQQAWLWELRVVKRGSGGIVRVYLWRPLDLLQGRIDEALR